MRATCVRADAAPSALPTVAVRRAAWTPVAPARILRVAGLLRRSTGRGLTPATRSVILRRPAFRRGLDSRFHRQQRGSA
jgi:hypothetical protein